MPVIRVSTHGPHPSFTVDVNYMIVAFRVGRCDSQFLHIIPLPGRALAQSLYRYPAAFECALFGPSKRSVVRSLGLLVLGQGSKAIRFNYVIDIT